MMKICIYVILIIAIFFSCSQSEKGKVLHIIKEWIGKEIIYSSDIVLTRLGQDTIKYIPAISPYTIITYVDSTGCVDSSLRLPKWKKFISELDSMSRGTIPVLFIFHSKKMEDVISVLKRNNFNYMVCIDENDSFNRLNHFSTNLEYQTLLLDKDRKVIAIGNPVYNPQIKKLYLNIIQGKSLVSNESERKVTDVEVKDKSVSLGKFGWQQEQQAEFVLTNTGANPLVIDNITTSCGCTSIDYSKEPVRPGCSVSLNMKYKAEHPGHFNKTITVYCNAKSSPIVLRIIGDAE